jgi:hypothetical protein
MHLCCGQKLMQMKNWRHVQGRLQENLPPPPPSFETCMSSFWWTVQKMRTCKSQTTQGQVPNDTRTAHNKYSVCHETCQTIDTVTVFPVLSTTVVFDAPRTTVTTTVAIRHFVPCPFENYQNRPPSSSVKFQLSEIFSSCDDQSWVWWITNVVF